MSAYPPLREPRDRSGDEAEVDLDYVGDLLDSACRRARTLAEVLDAIDEARDLTDKHGIDEPESPRDEALKHLRTGPMPESEDDESEELWAWDAPHVLCGTWPELHIVTRAEYVRHDEETPRVCPSCQGSGEGMSEYSACRRCRGTGGLLPGSER